MTARASRIGLRIVADAGDRAGIAIVALHQRGVEFVAAVGVEHRAEACVEARRILEHDDRGDDRIERAAAARQHRVAGIERAVEVGADRRFVLGAQGVAFDDTGAAMDGEGDGVGHGHSMGWIAKTRG